MVSSFSEKKKKKKERTVSYLKIMGIHMKLFFLFLHENMCCGYLLEITSVFKMVDRIDKEMV